MVKGGVIPPTGNYFCIQAAQKKKLYRLMKMSNYELNIVERLKKDEFFCLFGVPPLHNQLFFTLPPFFKNLIHLAEQDETLSGSIYTKYKWHIIIMHTR